MEDVTEAIQQHRAPRTRHPRPAPRERPRAQAAAPGAPRQPARAAARRGSTRGRACTASPTPSSRRSSGRCIAGHDIVLLGERGQGKTRLLRSLVGLLDEWTPGHLRLRARRAPLRPDHRHLPAGARRRTATTCASRGATATSGTPRSSRPRTRRVADLIGDVDPMKVAEGRHLGDPETIHFGLIPRSHRGIVAINELPDLAERIQVAMLNVMEERDIQIRGYVLRLPLDVLVVASANPEDYTNRGRIITPLKDRFGAEIRTHYPREVDEEIAVIAQEADLVAEVPDYLLEVLARFTRNLRESSRVDQRSGVSARFAIAGAETIAAAALHRATTQGEDVAGGPRRRPGDRRRRARRQDRVRDRRGGPRDRDPHPPAAHRGRRDRPGAPAPASTCGCSSRPSRRAPWSAPAPASAPATSSPACRCWGSPTSTTQVGDRLGATNDGERAARDRAGPRGALPRPPDRQGDRRRGDRLWLSSGRHGPRPARSPTSPAFRALGEAVVPPTYGPIDAAYAQRMLDEWWIPEVFATSLARNAARRRRGRRPRSSALANLGRLTQSYRDFPHVTGDREVMWKLYVHPDHQGAGIGSRLLADVEALVEGDELWLEVVDGNDAGLRLLPRARLRGGRAGRRRPVARRHLAEGKRLLR